MFTKQFNSISKAIPTYETKMYDYADRYFKLKLIAEKNKFKAERKATNENFLSVALFTDSHLRPVVQSLDELMAGLKKLLPIAADEKERLKIQQQITVVEDDIATVKNVQKTLNEDFFEELGKLLYQKFRTSYRLNEAKKGMEISGYSESSVKLWKDIQKERDEQDKYI